MRQPANASKIVSEKDWLEGWNEDDDEHDCNGYKDSIQSHCIGEEAVMENRGHASLAEKNVPELTQDEADVIARQGLMVNVELLVAIVDQPTFTPHSRASSWPVSVDGKEDC